MTVVTNVSVSLSALFFPGKPTREGWIVWLFSRSGAYAREV